MKRYREEGNIEPKRKSGRPKKWNDADLRIVHDIVRMNIRASIRELVDVGREMGHNYSKYMIEILIQKSDLRKYVAARKPLLNEAKISKRLLWVTRYRPWMKGDWQNITFSDESYFTVFGKSTRAYVWRMPGDNEKYAWRT